MAREAARRFLFTTLLISWANHRFGLLETGQRALVYHAPVPSVHQEELSSCISDSFYRELFMSPCLSGWSDGEAKYQYMHLCHQVLSRSQLNAVAKLREAGIVANDLIVLPSLSNVSLANNGIHVSIGSRMLDRRLRSWSGFLPEDEKRLGDLAIKIYEHFLPLFVGTYSAAPYRIGFTQFHPERLLSFLPHELDFTHLRLLWREWKEKAQLRVFGRPLTPYGPRWLDDAVAKRPPAAWRLCSRCAAAHLPGGLAGKRARFRAGRIAGQHCAPVVGTGRTRHRRPAHVVLHAAAPARAAARWLLRALKRATTACFPATTATWRRRPTCNNFLLAFAYRLALQGEVTHEQIPDDPTSESERRQPFFFSAAGLSAFYVHQDSRNQFLRGILRNCKKTRPSRRHPEYVRISIRDYRNALLTFLQQSASDVVEAMDMRFTLADLAVRCASKQHQASHRLIASALGESANDAMKVEAREFNRTMEEFYRDGLRCEHLREALADLREDLADAGTIRHAMKCGGGFATAFGCRISARFLQRR